jgi:hypothetical protein
MASETRPPVPPFTDVTALQKVQAAQDAWNSRCVRPLAALALARPSAATCPPDHLPAAHALSPTPTHVQGP